MDNDQNETLFLPDFCGVRALFGVIVMAELLAFVVTLVSQPDVLAHLDAFALISLLIQLIALSSAALLCISRSQLARLTEVSATLIMLVGILVVCYLMSEVAWRVLGSLGAVGSLVQATHAGFLFRNIAICALASALALRYFYVQFHWKRQVEAESQARLQALQSRIRPHFLFNCMNTIASLIRTRPDTAESAVEDLADLFRASLSDVRNLVRLDEELALCKQYLGIESLRLGPRLQVDWALEGLPDDARIPMLTLQPLVENAIYHGIEPRPDGGTINITGQMKDAVLEILIRNPTSEGAIRSGNRVAQDNVRQRLQAHFGEQGSFVVRESAEDLSYEVVVTFPYSPDKYE
jgi:two-component system sensor histidine kinase AlgZ